jgi:hypothetical protein
MADRSKAVRPKIEDLPRQPEVLTAEEASAIEGGAAVVRRPERGLLSAGEVDTWLLSTGQVDTW